MKRLTSYTILGDDLNFVLVDRKSVQECLQWQKELKLLAAYEELELLPEQIKEFSSIYLDKCEEVNRLNAELAEYKKFEDSITFNHVLELIKAEENKLFEESKQPQGDLISRSALIQQLREEGRLTYLIKGAIDNLPTAYDVEKVVEQLDKNCFSPDNYPGYAIDAELAVDIVRAGGKE